MADDKKVYLPRMKVRDGYRHSYQGKNVIIVDRDRKETPASADGKKAKAK